MAKGVVSVLLAKPTKVKRGPRRTLIVFVVASRVNLPSRFSGYRKRRVVRVPSFRVVPSFGISHLGMPSGRISASGSSLVHGNSVEVEAQATFSAYMFEVLDHSDQRSASENWLRRNE